MMDISEKTLYGLFDVLREYTFLGGGDGDSVLIAPNYLEYADAFEKYEKSLATPFFTNKICGNDFISFGNSQESICFCSPESGINGCEITMRTYW